MELKAELRTILGKQVKQLRRDGFIPAEVYGHGKENIHISVPTKDFTKLFKQAGENSVITLEVDGKKLQVFIASVDMDYIKNTVNSIDFHEVTKGERIHVHVPVKLTGIAPAVKTGKMVMQTLNEIEIEAAIDAIPHELSIDISSLEKEGDVIHVNMIKLPTGAKLISQGDLVVASIAMPAKEEAVAPVAEVAPVEEKKGEKKEDKKEEKK